MADKKQESKIVLERTYTIPIRRETLKAPAYRKAKKAVNAVRNFLIKHMKSDNVSIGRYLNMKLWQNGIKNPPGKVRVVATKDDKGKVAAEIIGAPKEKAETKRAKTKEAPKAEAKTEAAKEEKAEEAKKIEQEEIKELKKEQKEQHPKQKHAPKVPAQPKNVEAHPSAPKHV